MRNYIILAIFAVILAGCATSYQKQGFTGGFSEIRLGKNIFKVTFNGNVYTSRERASDFALLRSAELALKNGFKYFIIVNSEKYAKTEEYTTPITSYTTGSAYGTGNYAYGNTTTTTTGGQTYFYSKPSSTDTIVGFKKKPDVKGLVYNAEFVIKSIKNKYGIKN
ncbi:MAG TPA: hypothetical protein ENG97_01715 [Deltaproteobacteria bacterium]|nr:MAG: hypothetical protein IEMM0003_0368 [bacterium]HDH10550.1 hypothetical protein [Deltaproteobacteria bacterium]